jgi:hypothetical protein
MSTLTIARDPKHEEALRMINDRVSGKAQWIKYMTRMGYYLPQVSYCTM